MAENSKIQWTTHTFNPWRGCTKVSPGCQHCYAELLSKRNPRVLGEWGPEGKRVVASESAWREPLAWNREAQKAGERHRVFCASLADVFEGPETMPADSWEEVERARERLWATIWCTPNLDWLLLTKRPDNIVGPQHHIWAPGATANSTGWVIRMAGEEEGQRFYSSPWPSPNVWLGVSVEDQQRADERIPHMLQVPAAVRFLSCEPLLGRIEFSDVTMRSDAVSQLGKKALSGIDWVIIGGESGPRARPCVVNHIRALVKQCRAASVACFVKQLGAHPLLEADPLPTPQSVESLFCHGEYDPEPLVMKLRDPKGGDLDEFPADLQIREFPQPKACRTV